MRVVLVEDSPGDARWFQIVLDEIGVKVDLKVFCTGIEALEYLGSSPPPDLIVSEWALPVLTFEEFMSAITSIPAYESTPIAVLTSLAAMIHGRVLALGAICGVDKPISAYRLREILGGTSVAVAGTS